MVGKILVIVLRSFATYIILLVLGRIIGRKLISRITFFDFKVGVTLGSIAVRIALAGCGGCRHYSTGAYPGKHSEPLFCKII